MEREYKITIPEPCHEDWDKMTPNDIGRFCGSCSKNVVDFTNMLPEEIQVYFQQHNNVCGRFKKSQLDSLTIQIPSQLLYSQTQYHKMFLLALFVAMGTTLFSCTNKNGNKQKIDKVEIIEDSTKIHSVTIGALLPPKIVPNDTLHHNIPPASPKTNQLKFKKPKNIRCGEVTSKKEEKIKNENNIIYEDTTIYSGVAGIEVKADYPGGLNKFYTFIKENYSIPRKVRKTKGEIKATFIIGRDGVLTDIKIIKDVGFGTGEELTRVLKLAKKWAPGEQNGKPISEKHEIHFLLTYEKTRGNFLFNKNKSKIDSLELKIKI